MNNHYRIFLSYRMPSEERNFRQTAGYRFVETLYDKIIETDNYRDIFGEPYFSSRTDPNGNFLTFDFLDEVEFFIIPYTEGFFRVDPAAGKPVIFQEIEKVLSLSKPVHFIAIFFPGYEDEERLDVRYRDILDPIYYDKLSSLTGAKQRWYSPERAEDLLEEIYEELIVREDILDIVRNECPNLYMSTKKETERFPIYRRLYGVQKLTFLNFAATSLISGIDISPSYEPYDKFRNWFETGLIENRISCDIILTRPGSEADLDASLYKMRPGKLDSGLYERFMLSSEWSAAVQRGNPSGYHFIIRHNFNKICQFKLRNHCDKLRLYCTDTVLPYGLMKSEYPEDKRNRNNIKVDIYGVNIKDSDRPSFLLFENNPATTELYNVFNNSLESFFADGPARAVEFSGHPNVDFLFHNPIIHQAKLKQNEQGLTASAITQCANKGYPIEVDLLFAGGQILVWRDENCEKYGFGIDTMLSELDKYGVEEIRKKNRQILTLQELLALVIKTAARKKRSAPIPLLIELKNNTWEGTSREERRIRDQVISVCRIMERYRGEYALHAADPRIVRDVKEFDARIPCGQITLEFDNTDYRNSVSEEYKKVHREARYYDYVIPDFITYRIGDFRDSIHQQKQLKYKLRCLGWTAVTSRDYYAQRKDYDQLLVEYDPEDVKCNS